MTLSHIHHSQLMLNFTLNSRVTLDMSCMHGWGYNSQMVSEGLQSVYDLLSVCGASTKKGKMNDME